jgi:hypothetical protein
MIQHYLKNSTDYWEVNTAGTLHMIWFEPKVALKVKGKKGLTDIEMTPEEAEKMASELLNYAEFIRETKNKLLNKQKEQA